MRQRLTIILTVIVIIGLLVIINTVTYVGDRDKRDNEITPNRSTYHAGPTGLRALYDFLSESGYKVMRWREAPDKLLSESGQQVSTFVVVGRTQVDFTDAEEEALREWVARGGNLVLIDRGPKDGLLPSAGDWSINAVDASFPPLRIDPGNPKEMTEGGRTVQAVQATVLTQDIQSVMPSKFASRITIEARTEPKQVEHSSSSKTTVTVEDVSAGSHAPVVHLADGAGPLLVDYGYGAGRIALLSDPYFVANGGINLGDNLQLAINLLTSANGLIAFDEYHQGRGATQNAFAGYFAGTPVLPLAGQLALLLLLVLWTRARRFARPLPLAKVDRRSSLEFVASMAELQERSRAFDLAIENIYSRTRRVLARHAGVDYNSSRSTIAHRVASRSSLDADKLELLMRQCEEIINGAPVSWRQAIDLVRRVRQVEASLGLRMRSREVRQAAEKIEV
ncbi:MAG TPA: DUF4350 domain-containing protein [Pyrinomonadaceae bacterium]|nr:DUF4350 domain-containing protein [Pyrinomonadaceae bacterium]